MEFFHTFLWNPLQIDSVFLHFVIQSLAVDGQQTRSLALIASGGTQGGLDALKLVVLVAQCHVLVIDRAERLRQC